MSELVFDGLSIPELSFDEATHIYRVNGIEIQSVSTLMTPLRQIVYGDIDPAVLAFAAGRGTEVHDAFETYIAYGIEEIRPEYQGYMDAFKEWLDEFKPEPLGTEVRIYHKIMRYGGTADLICKINGVTTLIDYKTSSTIHAMLCGVQLEAYDRAFDSHGVKIADRAIFHPRKDGTYEYVHFNERQEHWRVVTALMTLRNYTMKF